MITVFMPYSGLQHSDDTITELKNCNKVAKIFLLANDDIANVSGKTELLKVD